ncbi:T9SS type A sorting domain-containing protein [bacterium SCSIO 12643]|nr:T9SS type A sorting domain-containing protein [bacterium SCSIO 12643]
MKYLKLLIFLNLIIVQVNSYSQIDSFSICNSFDSNVVLINIDSSGIWEIGKPNKSEFDSSYSGLNSIVTDLDSLYPNKDTSIFYASYSYHGWIPNYLGLFYPLEIELIHRFDTDSIYDYGTIEMSFNGGNTWYDVLSSTYNYTWGDYENYHYFFGLNDTIFDSLSVTGNSNGWVHSKISKNIEQLVFGDSLFKEDSILLKFSFVADSIGRHEGWQIDNLCIKMDIFNNVNELANETVINISPNPAQETIRLQFLDPNIRDSQELKIYSITGQLVLYQIIHPPESEINIKTLESGVYMYVIGDYRGKIVIE